jgi:hypothetical protein
MPLLEPTNHGGSNTHLFHANTAKHAARLQPVTSMNALKVNHRFAIPFDSMPGVNGLWVREPDGSFTYKPWSYDEAAKNGYAPEDIFVVGRGGYYLTMEEARMALPLDTDLSDPSFVHGVHYVDDYNDEFQDFFVCAADGIEPEPFLEAHAQEPIQ